MNDGPPDRPPGEPDPSSPPEGPTLSLFATLSESGRLIAGRYRIETLLGEGGFGRVYRAFDQKLARIVALKTLSLLQGHPGQGDKVQRFEEEARAVARLDHPSIVPVYDAGFEEETPWMAMRLGEGPSLGGVLGDKGPLPPPRALSPPVQRAAAPSHADRRGLAPGGENPANILLEE